MVQRLSGVLHCFVWVGLFVLLTGHSVPRVHLSFLWVDLSLLRPHLSFARTGRCLMAIGLCVPLRPLSFVWWHHCLVLVHPRVSGTLHFPHSHAVKCSRLKPRWSRTNRIHQLPSRISSDAKQAIPIRLTS
jgi:hypothetical protein